MMSYYQDRKGSLPRNRRQFGGVRHDGRISTYICIGRNPDLWVREKELPLATATLYPIQCV